MARRYPEPRAPRPGSTRAWRALREVVLDRDGHTCQAPGCGALETCVDHHIVPVARGGSDWPGNLRATCQRCLAHTGEDTASVRTGGRVGQQATHSARGASSARGGHVDFQNEHAWSPRYLAAKKIAQGRDTR